MSFFILELGIRIKKKKIAKVLPWTKSSLFMNCTAYLTSQESLFQISNHSVKPFDLEVDEHRDIEFQNYYIDFPHNKD